MYILIYKIDILLDFDFNSKFFRLYIMDSCFFMNSWKIKSFIMKSRMLLKIKDIIFIWLLYIMWYKCVCVFC